MPRVAPFPLLCLFLLAAGCARGSGGDFPSLAERPQEARGFAEPDAPPPAVAAPDPALDARVAGLGRRLDAAAAAFDAAAGRARTAAARARGAGAGSEAWIAAQERLSELDAARADASAAVTDAGELAVGRAATLAPPYPSLESLRDRANAELARQAGVIADLSASLAPA